MSEDMRAELQHWQARTDEMQVAMERLRNERDIWKTTCETQTISLNKQEDEIKQRLKNFKKKVKGKQVFTISAGTSQVGKDLLRELYKLGQG